jgi:hypothetical protein
MTDEPIIPTPPPVVLKSARWSFKGYSFLKWWKLNKGIIKTAIAFAVFLALFFRADLATPELSAGVALVGAVAVKKALDVIDFGTSEVAL